ncbi:hypothetical protein GGR50DRAFT_623683 [Xylaria sp. CBS 124048]|nr:hypothetical protein GGR50DRAFT_623683 [Xylaria sp. CBS 124048]
MAHSIEPASIISSTPDLSFSDILSDTKIRRSLVKIASAQKQLLSRHESWASFLSRRPHGFVNVPPDVLEQLKACHIQQKRAIEQPKATSSTSHAEHRANVPGPSGRPSSPPCRMEQDSEDSIGDDHETSTQISWPQSPDAHLRPPEAESNVPSQSFMTQLFERSPPQTTNSTDAIELPNSPRSSQGPEDELEVEVPTALAHNPVPINKLALPMPATPPSAQIPCTFEPTQSVSTDDSVNSDPQPKAQSRQAIYKAIPQLYHPSKQDFALGRLKLNAGALKLIVESKGIVAIEGSSSSSDTSSSIIPATNMNHKAPESKDVVTHNAMNSRTYRSSAPNKSPSPVYIPPPLSHVASSLQPPASITRLSVPPADATKSQATPFIHYKATYPTYGGTVQDFLTACTYIQGQHRRIRTSLYDDFIRAWFEGYLPYVEECDAEHPSRQAMEAIEWYNEIDDDPEFTLRIVTRLNLPSILKAHLDSAELPQNSTGSLFSSARSESAQNCGELSTGENEISQHPPHKQQSKGKTPAQEPAELHGQGSRLSSIANPKSQLSSNSPAPIRNSLIRTETQQTHPKPSTRPQLEAISSKRPAIDELRSETKRTSRNHLADSCASMWPDPDDSTGIRSEQSSNVARSSAAPESTSRGQRMEAAKDAEEKRRQRLAKHFKKRMAAKEVASMRGASMHRQKQ